MLQSIRVFNGRKGISESMVKLGEIIDICSETLKQLIISHNQGTQYAVLFFPV